MKTEKLSNMVRGWFVGDFEPSVYRTNAVEAAVKSYKAGDCEQTHYHKIATEITVIASGTVRMSGVTYSVGDMIIIEPGDSTDFIAVTDSITVVVKIPGANNEKYM